MTVSPPERNFITQAAERLHDNVLRAKGKLAESAFDLGGALARIQDEKAYTALGFATFEDYLASPEVAIHRTTAYRFLRVFRTYQHVAHGLRGPYDIQKLDLLGKLIDPDMDPAQVAVLIEEARPIPREELRARMNAVDAARARPRGVPPPPPTPLDTPLRQEEQARAQRVAAGLGVIGAALVANPEYVAAVLRQAFHRINWVMLRLHEKPVRELVASTSPEEMAAAISSGDPRGEGFGSEARRFERDIKPILDWYARVGELLNDPPATIRRVK